MARKLVTSRTLSASFMSPDSESLHCSDCDRGLEKSKGWYSDRVPQGRHKRHVAAAALMPFSSGRALPSKWDDAERWISSPNVKEGVGFDKNSVSAHVKGRVKSKSGPLGPVGVGEFGRYNTFSPVLGVGVMHGGKLWRDCLDAESSPVFVTNGGGGAGGVCEGRRSSLTGRGDSEWLDLWSGPISPSDKGKLSDGMVSMNNLSPNNNNQGYNDDVANVSRRDMATQMYPENGSSSSYSSIISSPRSMISTKYPFHLHRELDMNVQFSELEIKDVQVDNQTCSQVKGSSLNSNSREGDTNTIARFQKEEARIIAWENLQKAKAESSIQKLEMKLEKKRASSMKKITEKLRRAEIKAQKMRISVSENFNQVRSRAILKATSKIPSFCRRLRLSSFTRSFSSCYPL